MRFNHNTSGKLPLLFSLLFTLLWITACGGGSENKQVVAPTGNAIQDLLNAAKVPGISIAVIKNYKIDTLKVYGVADANTQQPVSTETLFQAASISKVLTAIAALALAQDGQIDLDEDINNSLTSWQISENTNTATHKVTLAGLLSHTAGVNVHGFIGYKQNESIPSLLQILNGQSPANSKKIRVEHIPGQSYQYSGGGYCIVQQAIEDITSQQFADVLQSYVLAPLAMNNSSFELPSSNSINKPFSAGHKDNGAILEGGFYIYPELAPAGLWTTAEDLAKLTIELMLSLNSQSNLLLSTEMTEKMITPIKSNVYGMGLELYNNAKQFGHSGHNIGFYSLMVGDQTNGNGVVILANGEGAGDNDFFNKLLGIIDRGEY